MDFLERLLQYQLGGSDIANGKVVPTVDLLSRFSNDVEKIGAPIGSPKGMAQSGALNSALVALAIEDYYFMPASRTSQLFNTAGIKDGVSFDLSDSSLPPATESKAIPMLISAADSLVMNNTIATNIIATDQNWYIQSDNEGMTASGLESASGHASVGDDVLIGGGTGNHLVGGNGNNVLIAGSGYNTIVGGTGAEFDYFQAGFNGNTLQGRSTLLDWYQFVVNAMTTGTDTITDRAGLGSIWIGNTQLTGAAGSGGNFTWTASDATTYHFDPYLSDGVLQTTGTLTISNGAVGSGDQLVIQDFNLTQAEAPTGSGYLGIRFTEQLAIEAGLPSNPLLSGAAVLNTVTNATGTTQNITIFASAATNVPQTVTLQLAGADASQFIALVGSNQVNFSSGSVTLTIPAGASSVTLGLIYAGDGSQAATAQLTATLASSGSSGTTPTSNTLAVTFAGTPTLTTPTQVINGTASSTTVNGQTVAITQYAGDNANDVINTDNGPNLIGVGNGGDSIVAGSGNNTISAGNGNDTIVGGGGQDIFNIGNGNNQIYAGSAVSVSDALSQQQNAIAVNAQGDFFGVGDGNNTIVGGNGNDYVNVGAGNNLVVLGAGQNAFVGGVEDTASSGWSFSINLTGTADSASVDASGVIGTSAPYTAPLVYLGNYNVGEDAIPVGVGNDTIFGGKGDSLYLLSNGNNYLDAGGGNDFISTGMGSNTIFGGAGNDTIYGDGGTN